MPAYFEFEVSLKGVTPKISRRFFLPQKATFDDLHQAIQDSCGWEYCHLFLFLGGGWGSEPIAEDPNGDQGEAPVASEVKLASYFTPNGPKKCLYIYDFGDDWMHEVVLKKVVELPEKFKRRLKAAKGVWPPEDCGGVWGYKDLLELVQKKKDGKRLNSDEKSQLEWLGDWNSEEPDVEALKESFDK